jgi:hypothetical protein
MWNIRSLKTCLMVSQPNFWTTPFAGNFSEHVLLQSGDDLYHLWMDKIGPYLGDWVLGMSRYGMFIIQLSRPVLTYR